MISIITVNKNHSKSLCDCLYSVSHQSFNKFNHIIIDGHSSDDSINVIQQYSQSNRNSHWVSEPDTGIADAMNKGIQRASGDWLLFLHADDQLASNNILEAVYCHLDPSTPLVCFSTLIGEHPPRIISPKGWCTKTYFKTTIPHQGCIIYKSLFDRLGFYDTSFKICMDYEWFLRAFHLNIPIKILPHIILAHQSDQGISSKCDWPNLKLRYLEEQKAHFKNCPTIQLKALYFIYWKLYLPYRRFTYRNLIIK